MRSQGVPEDGGQQGLQLIRPESRSEGPGKQAICPVNKVNSRVEIPRICPGEGRRRKVIYIQALSLGHCCFNIKYLCMKGRLSVGSLHSQ